MAQQKQPSCQALNGRTNDKERLSRALDALNRHFRVRDTHEPILQTKDDYYFIERTLIEMELLKGDKNKTAHKAFIELMDSIGFEWRLGRPNNKHLSRGAAGITKDPFPWQAAETEIGKHFEAELPRRCDIYRIIRNKMADET